MEYVLFWNKQALNLVNTMINKGMRIFDLLDQRQKLSLISATPYECGVTVLRYQLNKH
jgi:hypothetical protein